MAGQGSSISSARTARRELRSLHRENKDRRARNARGSLPGFWGQAKQHSERHSFCTAALCRLDLARGRLGASGTTQGACMLCTRLVHNAETRPAAFDARP